MSSKKIENEEQYQTAIQWLAKTSIELEDPLNNMSAEERERTLAIYDRTSELIQSYRRGELAQKYTGLRKAYATLGWSYNDETEPELEQGVSVEKIGTESSEMEQEFDPFEDLIEDDDEQDDEPEIDLDDWLG